MLNMEQGPMSSARAEFYLYMISYLHCKLFKKILAKIVDQMEPCCIVLLVLPYKSLSIADRSPPGGTESVSYAQQEGNCRMKDLVTSKAV